jgi:hypothetical protein
MSRNPDPDPLVTITDPRIRIRTKMSQIPNTNCYRQLFVPDKITFSELSAINNNFFILLFQACHNIVSQFDLR